MRSDTRHDRRARGARTAGLVLSLASLAVTAAPASAAAQSTRAQTTAAIVVHRSPTDSVVITAERFAALPHETLRTTDHDTPATFRGVPLRAVLQAAGVRLDSLRGPRLADVLLAEAADNYRVAFSLGELAGDFGNLPAFVADQRDGKALAAAEGPYRVVIPGEKHPTRWIRQLRRLTVLRVAPPAP